MGKINVRVYHKDQAYEDHSHKMPNGEFTGGQLMKPNKDRTFMHTHLYQHMGKTIESTPAPIGGDHTHITEAGVTSGPTEVRKDSVSESVRREGPYWVKRSITGHVIARGMNRNDVEDDKKKSDLMVDQAQAPILVRQTEPLTLNP